MTLITDTPVGGGPPRLRSWRLEWVADEPGTPRKKAQLSRRSKRNTGRKT
jgi:hypothetical protein